jgi:hypothetical protein
MATFLITGPDGKKYRVTGDNKEGALAALKAKLGDGPRQTNLAEQVGSGTSEGVAGFLGTPVDLMTGLINGLAPRNPYQDAGTTLEGGVKLKEVGAQPAVSAPVGGSDTFTKMLSPFISQTPPQTMMQRYGRRAGQEIGYGVPAAATLGMAPALRPAMAAAPGTYMATSMAGDMGSAVAGQTSQEIAPGNQTADFISSLLGGGAASLAAASMTPAYNPTPTRQDIATQANDAWDKVRAAPEALTPQATDDLRAKVRAALPTSQLAETGYPQAFEMSKKMDVLDRPTIWDVEDLRQIIGDKVAGDPKESRVGMGMKSAISDYLGRLTPNDVTTPSTVMNADPGAAIDNLTRARDLSARGHRADAILNKEMRGERRAATSGTGGNEVNAIRQNIGALLDKERDPTLRGQRAGFKPSELDQMKDIVFGTTATNEGRRFGRLAPTSGAFPMAATGIGGFTGLAGIAAGGSPLLAVPAAVGGVGLLAKGAAETITQSQIKKLLATILSGGNLTPSPAREAAKAAILQQLLSSAANGPQ